MVCYSSFLKTVRKCLVSHFDSRQCVFKNGIRNDDGQELETSVHDCYAR